MGEASFAMKLWGAIYYMTASMVVQLMNKVPTESTFAWESLGVCLLKVALSCGEMHTQFCTVRQPPIKVAQGAHHAFNLQALFTSYNFQCPLLVGLLQMAIIVPVRVQSLG